MRPFIESFAFGVLCVSVALASACGRDHSGLAEKPSARGGAAGSAGLGGTGGSAGRGRGGTGAAGMATGGVGGRIVEPPGRSVTTFFHGIVDAERVAFCFAGHGDGDPEIVGDPIPPDGLAFAQSIALESIPRIDLEAEAVLPYVIAGELDLIADMNCDEAVETARNEMAAVNALSLGAGGESGAGGAAGASGGGGAPEPPTPPRLRVSTLPEIPAGALAEGYSSLYVAVGCLGGPAFAHAVAEDACGDGYTPDTPTRSAMLVSLSRRTAFDKLALQALNASLASPALTVSSAPPDTAVQATVPVVYDLGRGSLSPREPSTQFSITDWGVASPGWKAQASSAGTVLFSELWPDVLERAGIDAFQAGRGYTLVVVGPRGNFGPNGFWNRAAIGVVDNDPEL